MESMNQRTFLLCSNWTPLDPSRSFVMDDGSVPGFSSEDVPCLEPVG